MDKNTSAATEKLQSKIQRNIKSLCGSFSIERKDLRSGAKLKFTIIKVPYTSVKVTVNKGFNNKTSKK